MQEIDYGYNNSKRVSQRDRQWFKHKFFTPFLKERPAADLFEPPVFSDLLCNIGFKLMPKCFRSMGIRQVYMQSIGELSDLL